ncbi:hypothetical protein JNW88_11445 [Micromonospora sp. ATA32]|nr:hypothetical protein [Micromonospora sp. ATA32]
MHGEEPRRARRREVVAAPINGGSSGRSSDSPLRALIAPTSRRSRQYGALFSRIRPPR